MRHAHGARGHTDAKDGGEVLEQDHVDTGIVTAEDKLGERHVLKQNAALTIIGSPCCLVAIEREENEARASLLFFPTFIFQETWVTFVSHIVFSLYFAINVLGSIHEDGSFKNKVTAFDLRDYHE